MWNIYYYPNNTLYVISVRTNFNILLSAAHIPIRDSPRSQYLQHRTDHVLFQGPDRLSRKDKILPGKTLHRPDQK